MNIPHAAALKAAEEIDRECLEFVTWSRHDDVKPVIKIADIIARHFPAQAVDRVNLKLVKALCKIDETLTGSLPVTFKALAFAESAPASLESELAEALREILAMENSGYIDCPVATPFSDAKEILARYDAQKPK